MNGRKENLSRQIKQKGANEIINGQQLYWMTNDENSGKHGHRTEPKIQFKHKRQTIHVTVCLSLLILNNITRIKKVLKNVCFLIYFL